MNRRIVMSAVVVALAAAGVAGNFAVSRGAPTPVPTADVVLLRCTSNGGGDIAIAESDSSVGAPLFSVDSSCAVALSSLIKKGFRFQAVQGDDVFLYTMLKP
jgi:hypothetical protein